MNPFTLPDTRRSGTEQSVSLSLAASPGRSSRSPLRETGPSVAPEITLGADVADVVEEVEAPALTMVGPAAVAARSGGKKTPKALKKPKHLEQTVSKPAAPKSARAKRAEEKRALLVESAASAPMAKRKAKKSWKFWKRSDQRMEELQELRKGCEEISGVMGSIRDHLAVAAQDRQIMHKTLSPLPLAVDGLRRVGDNQRRTHEILEGLQGCVERTEQKDAIFFKSMDRLGDAMSTMDMVVVGMGRTFSSIERNSKASTAALEKLAARIDASDRFMETAFSQMKESEKEFTAYVTTNSRRSAMVTITICALMTLGITMLAYTLSQTSTVEMPILNIPGMVPAATELPSGAGVPTEGTLSSLVSTKKLGP